MPPLILHIFIIDFDAGYAAIIDAFHIRLAIRRLFLLPDVFFSPLI